MIEQFHFLRPAWLILLPVLLILLWQGFQRRNSSRSWQSVVDAQLLPHLLAGKNTVRDNSLWLLAAIVAVLGIVALAGPVWDKLPQPIYRQQAALVIVLDLSSSMDVADIKPSRLARARHKITDILATRKEGQTALVTYAADAFVVTPLTEDTATIDALIPALSSQIMPTQGSAADKALAQAFALFDNAGVAYGDVLLVSDGFNPNELTAMQSLLSGNPNHRVSVLGIGTEAGGPIPLGGGGFLKDDQGSIVIARLQTADTRDIVRASGGAFELISNDDTDINRLMKTIDTNRFETDAVESDLQADIWREQGPWLVLILIPLVALVFRRGILLVLPLLLLPVPPDAQALGWDELWQNQNQLGKKAFDNDQHQIAAETFSDPEWKASSHYRTGDYGQALQQWQAEDSARGFYNQGNALTKLGRLPEAIDAYQKALDLNADNADAAYNKKLVEDALEQQQQQQNQQGDQNQDQQSQDQQSQEQQDQQQPSEQSDNQDENQSGQSKDEQNQSDDPQQQSEAEQSEQEKQQAETEQQDPADMSENLEQQMSEQAAEQWLRKIPDDPGGLLRRKFLYQYRQRGDNSQAENQW